MTLNLKNKKVIISAGASGIGWAITKECLKKGATVFLCDINKKFISGDIRITSRNEGDKINSLPNIYTRVKKVLSNHKEVGNKQNILVLRSNSEILWLVGIKQSISSYVEKKDSEVLEIRFLENPI